MYGTAKTRTPSHESYPQKTIKEKFFSAPKKMRQKHIAFTREQLDNLTLSLKTNYLTGGIAKTNMTAQEYNRELHVHLHKRLYYNRNRIMPWLDQIKALEHSKVLEIGCGTGVSTLALAEQGATVHAVDVDKGSLAVARDRLQMAGLAADLHLLNGDDIQKEFMGEKLILSFFMQFWNI